MMQRITAAEQIGRILTCLMLLVGYSAIAQNTGTITPPGVTLRATHILGFENISNNANGELSIQGDDLRFQKTGGAVAHMGLVAAIGRARGNKNSVHSRINHLRRRICLSALPISSGSMAV